MFVVIAIGFLTTFAMTVVNKKRDGSKGFEDTNYPVHPQPRVNMDKSSYGSMNRINIEQGNGPKAVTYCVIDGRMIDTDNPTSTESLLASLQ